MNKTTLSRLQSCRAALHGAKDSCTAASVHDLVIHVLDGVIRDERGREQVVTKAPQQAVFPSAWSEVTGALADAYSVLRAVANVAHEKGGYVPAAQLRAVDQAVVRLQQLVTLRGTLRKRAPSASSSDDV